MKEIYKMIGSFDFKEYLNVNQKTDNTICGWVIITDSQCVMGYTNHDGLGFHLVSISMAFQLLLQEDEYSPLVSPRFTYKNYIIGFMMSGKDSNYILFDFDQLGQATPNQKKLFLKMAEEYDEMIENRSKELGEGMVIVKANQEEHVGNNLSFAANYLKVDDEKQIPYDFCNVGQFLLENNKIKVKYKEE